MHTCTYVCYTLTHIQCHHKCQAVLVIQKMVVNVLSQETRVLAFLLQQGVKYRVVINSLLM